MPSEKGQKSIKNFAILDVTVQPNAKESKVVGLAKGAVKIRIKAPPTEGKANDELIRFLAKSLKLAKSQITIEHGASGRNKRIRIDGMDINQLNLLMKERFKEIESG